MQVSGPHQGGENCHCVYGQSEGSGEIHIVPADFTGLQRPLRQVLATILGATQNLPNTEAEDMFQRTLLEFRKDGARPKEVSTPLGT